ncbi:MAG TPA: matrixin family metalloprotease [Polyangiaceae bacterium]|nr:matrixin family metalloprotease [Polyangiaceae bacterium]
MRRARVVSAALGLAVLGATWHASAFCLTHGCNERKQDCGLTSEGCLNNGPLLHWPSSCVSFDVQKDGSPLRELGYDEAHEAVLNGFRQWINADCGDGQHPDVTMSDYGPVECHEAEYNQDAPNANIVMFRDDSWPYQNAIDTLALTTLIFNADTGAIYDADVEVNTFQAPMSLGIVGPGEVDFNSVITHELGHFLGLSHSGVPGSTMNRSYAPGDTAMASIEQDDVNGICAALPPGRAVASTSCEPRHGFSTECALPLTTCGFHPGGAGIRGSLLLAVLGLSAARRRKKPRP